MSILMERSARVECNKCPDAIRVTTFSSLGKVGMTPDEFCEWACTKIESYGWQQQPNHAWLCPAHLSEPPA